MELIVRVAPGLEAFAEAEVRALDACEDAEIAASSQRISLTFPDDAVPWRAIHALNLELGTARAVAVVLGRFGASQFPQLERRLRQLDTEPFLAAGGRVAVRVRSTRSRIYHTKAIEARVRAMLDARGLTSAPPDAATPATFALDVELVKNRALVAFDTSLEPLDRRGYRLATGKAPLRPDLAHALVLASGWERDTLLGDPFCGAGTIAIEAARLSRRVAPGLGRTFGFEACPAHEADAFDAQRDATRARLLADGPDILASDRDAGALTATRDNAARAGVAESVRTTEAAFSAAPIFEHADAGPRVLVSNPPYGVRVGKKATMKNLFGRLRARVEALPPRSRYALLYPAEHASHAPEASATAFTANHGGQHVVARRGRNAG